MTLLGMREVTIAFGGAPLLDRSDFRIDRGERVPLLGRNGTGKSTVLKLLDGSLLPDRGDVVRQGGVTVARLEQDVPNELSGSLYDVVAAGLGSVGTLLAQYHDASHRLSAAGSHVNDAALRELDRLHRGVDAANAWQLQTRVETVLEHLGLEADAPFVAASGGRKRQTLLARALVSDPDVLLLDEPTNHLDVEAIEWMERFLIERGVTLVFVTHDRAFLRRVATRIVELDRGQLTDWGSDYDRFLQLKEGALAAESREWSEFDKKLANEETWIRTGIRARRTRNEGRVRALESLRRERAARRERTGTMRAQLQDADRSGKLVIEARDLTFAHEQRVIVRDFSTTIMRGDRVGIVGGNGSGKTTLLRLLLGELTPNEGSLRLGTNLEIAYFDQLREQLAPETTVFDSIADGADFVQIGKERRHVTGYLQDFLFPPDRARTPVGALSGGERNRLLLARLFTRSFNVLALDEPTNDLDIETLELLEELLLDFSGTLLIVSHDREFLDHVVTSTLVMEGEGIVGEYAGGYSDWIRVRERARDEASSRPQPVSRPSSPNDPKPASSARVRTDRRRMSFRDQRELESLPSRIEELEGERARLYESLSDPALLRDGAATSDAARRLAAVDVEIEQATQRWVELESMAEQSDR